MPETLDSGDMKILRMVQENCKLTAREISDNLDLPVTTVFSKIKRMERRGIIKEYYAVLDHAKLGFGTTAFIFASFAYRDKGAGALSQREVSAKIASLPEVQEVHIISGDWDILMKVKAKDVESIGKFVVDKLRLVKGIEKTLTCFVFESGKESMAVPL
jgi:Lrp/AsnC family leucine-responsive transcriptional regulator